MPSIDVYNDPYSRKRNASIMRNEFEKLKRTQKFKVWKKQQLYKQQSKCAYCKISLTKENIVTHVDHIQPLYFEGKNVFDNFVLSCRRCNVKKWINDRYVKPDWIVEREKHLAKKDRLDPARASQRKYMKALVARELDEQIATNELSWLSSEA